KDSIPIVTDIWLTNEIQASNTVGSGVPQLDHISGFLMEFESSMSTMSMRMTCRSVEEIAVSDSLFVVPEGYKITSINDWMKPTDDH
ncbi:MAG: hypothetical protein ABUL44_02290, partial [Flavobacterium sp.]